MSSTTAQSVTITVNDAQRVSGLLQAPPEARACYVLAHGAGAGMAHPFMAAMANGLAERGIATLRYQFPFMEQGSKRPDAPKLAHATVRAAVLETSRLQLALFARGRSFCGRMISPTCRWSKRSAHGSVPAPPSSCFRMRIIRFTCPPAPDARIPTFEWNCWMRWRIGSGIRYLSQRPTPETSWPSAALCLPPRA